MTKDVYSRRIQMRKLAEKCQEPELAEKFQPKSKPGDLKSIPVKVEVIKKKLKELGWTQQDLTNRSREELRPGSYIALSTVKTMFRKKKASFETLKTICKSLKIEPHEVLTDDYDRVFLAFVAADEAIQNMLGGLGKWGWNEATNVMALLLTRNAAGVARRTKNLTAGEELIAVAGDFAMKAFPEYVFPTQPRTAPDVLRELRSKVEDAIAQDKGVASATEAADEAIHEALSRHGDWGLTEATVILSVLLNRFAAGCSRETAKAEMGFRLLDGIRDWATTYYEDREDKHEGGVATPVLGRKYGALEIHGNLPQHGPWVKSGVDAADNAIHLALSRHGNWGFVEAVAVLACLLARFAHGNSSNASDATAGADIIEGVFMWASIHFEDYVPEMTVDDIPGPDRVVAGPDPRWSYSGIMVGR